ncbi:MAG: hypothetical protein R3343_12895 [Nitriliruptorales bacterium]|nr:hypothetical protein [Nitriliruptorales bacterium]
MAERYTSRIALVLDEQVDDVGSVVEDARAAGDVDRAAAVQDGAEAQEVHWGGRMQKAVVRRVTDEQDGAPLLRTEAYIGDQGLTEGMRRQAQLLQGLSRQVDGVVAVRDLSAMVDRDEAWMNRLAVGAVELEDAITVHAQGEGVWWVFTHGAARFDIPDLELYGLNRSQVEGGKDLLRHVHRQLLDRGLGGPTTLPSGDEIYPVPVLEAWSHLNLDWPGVGKAGQDRGPGLDGPRATLSLLHKPRFGRYKKDFEGVIERIEKS